MSQIVTNWKCFHCGDVFTNPKHAAEHFGQGESDIVACKLKHSEGHLVTLIRKLESELSSYRRDDSHILRAWMAKEAEHAQALIREEEKGFSRGVADMRRLHEATREALRQCVIKVGYTFEPDGYLPQFIDARDAMRSATKLLDEQSTQPFSEEDRS